METNIDCQILFGDGEQVSVDRKTVGQFTELTNGVGIEFYSGDVVKCKIRKGIAMTRFIGVVKYSDIYCAYIIAGVKQYFGQKVFLRDAYNAQVIGNIHQNPELLGK